MEGCLQKNNLNTLHKYSPVPVHSVQCALALPVKSYLAHRPRQHRATEEALLGTGVAGIECPCLPPNVPLGALDLHPHWAAWCLLGCSIPGSTGVIILAHSGLFFCCT